MTRRLRLLIPLLAALGLAAVAPPARAATPNPLLDSVIASLPDAPLFVYGDLQRRNAHGDITGTYHVEMVLDWKADAPAARYTIRDGFGASLQHLAITWDADGRPAYQYLTGNPLRSAPLPPLSDTIQDTDITWLDLSLSFLWWPGGDLRGVEKVRGRRCRILDLPAPPGLVEDLAGVRLWIEEKAGLVLRAEGFDANQERTRRMDVRSVKKIDGQYMLNEVVFTRYPEKTQTVLLVRDLEARDRFTLPDPATRAPPGEPIDALPDLRDPEPGE
jgi:hypothetical protein